MKRLSLAWCLAVFVVIGPTAALAEKTTIDKVTLKPDETKTYTIEATTKTKVGYTPNSEQAKKCQKNCIEISQTGGVTVASKYGATIGMKPKDGKIEWTLKNLEAFPIEVEVYRK